MSLLNVFAFYDFDRSLAAISLSLSTLVAKKKSDHVELVNSKEENVG